MGREDEVGFLGYDDLLLGFNSHRGDIGALLLEGHGIEHDSAADDVDGTFPEYSGRDAPHDEAFTIKME